MSQVNIGLLKIHGELHGDNKVTFGLNGEIPADVLIWLVILINEMIFDKN